LGWLPQLKLHHIVLLTEPIENRSYAIDFTPLNQPHFSTLLQLFIAKNVPAEIRVCYLGDITNKTENQIIEQWDFLTTYKASFGLAHMKDTVIRENLLDAFSNWEPEMNVYTHNCQHFSEFLQKKMR
jgi:hypothetical protein